jgi:hypothetical protein
MFRVVLPLEALADEAVARAYARLLLALGGHASTADASRSVVRSEAVSAYVAPAASTPAAAPAAPVAQSPAPAPAPTSQPAAGWASFEAALPERSRRFLNLLRAQGQITLSEAMRALGLTEPKAMGGITGSIGRWAPAKGLPVPFAAFDRNGERAWRWIGGLVGEAPAASKPSAVVHAPAETPAKAAESTVSTVSTVSAPAPAPERVRGKPGRPRRNPLPDATPTPPPVIVVPRTTTRPAVVPPPPPGPIRIVPRPAPPVAAQVPAPAPAPAATVPTTPVQRAKPGPKPGLKAARAAAARAEAEVSAAVEKPAEKPADPARSALGPDELARLESTFSRLSDTPRRFMELLRQRGEVTMGQALEAFNLGRPIAMGAVIEPIQRITRESGIPVPFHTYYSASGEKVWVWPSSPPPPEGVRRRKP